MQPQTIRQMLIRHRQLGALFLGVALVAGCRSGRPMVEAPAPAAAGVSDAATPDATTPDATARDDKTAMEAATEGAADAGAGADTTSAAAVPAVAEAPGPVLAANAPNSYVVKRGDTLWGIAKVFLRDPWHWPEIWQVNPQIHNPHLIYPGDTLRLVFIEGHPQIVVQSAGQQVQRGNEVMVKPRVRSEPLEAAITTIPYATVAAFMSKPFVLSREQIKHAGYLLASLDDHAAIAEGNTVYARGFSKPPEIGMSYSVVRVGDALRDPDDNQIVGYNGVFTGTGRVMRGGDPATLVMTTSTRESEAGDKVLPSEVDMPLDFVPSAPKSRIAGRLIAVADGVTVIGQYQVVVINKGARDGLVPGNVLAVYKNGDVVRDDEKNGFLAGSRKFFAPRVRLPDERSGTYMVFKTFDRISFGLIMEAENIIHVGDRVENP